MDLIEAQVCAIRLAHESIRLIDNAQQLFEIQSSDGPDKYGRWFPIKLTTADGDIGITDSKQIVKLLSVSQRRIAESQAELTETPGYKCKSFKEFLEFVDTAHGEVDAARDEIRRLLSAGTSNIDESLPALSIQSSDQTFATTTTGVMTESVFRFATSEVLNVTNRRFETICKLGQLPPQDAAVIETQIRREFQQALPNQTGEADRGWSNEKAKLAAELTGPANEQFVTAVDSDTSQVADQIVSEVVEIVERKLDPSSGDLPEEMRLLAIAQEKCAPAETKAWLAEQYAIRRNGEFKDLPRTFEWLEEHFFPDAEDIPNGLRGYKLPKKPDTWGRQVRAVRKATGTNRNTKRMGRSHCSSIVSKSDI